MRFFNRRICTSVRARRLESETSRSRLPSEDLVITLVVTPRTADEVNTLPKVSAIATKRKADLYM